MGSINQNNSTTFPLDAGDAFTGIYSSTTDFSEICISVETDSQFQLIINFSSDGVNLGYSKTITEATPSLDAFIYTIQPYMRYFYVVLDNIDTNDQTYLRLSTIQKTIEVYKEAGVSSNVAITSPLNLDGSVFVGGNLALSGSVDANVTNASLNVSDSSTQSKLQSIYTDVQKSNKISATMWLSSVTGIGGVSLSANLSLVNQTNLSFYGNVSDTTVLTVQFSQDGTTFYDTQYSYSQTGAGNIGFNIQSSPLHVRLKSSNSVTATIYLNCN